MTLEKKSFKFSATIWSSSTISSASVFSSFSNKMILSFLAILPGKSGLTVSLLLSHSVLVSTLP